jgi:hypothetical protein
MINEKIETITIEELQTLIFKEYEKNGYHKMWTNGFKNNSPEQPIFDIAELSLIVTEISEAIEEKRKNGLIDSENLFIECADIIIRTLNFMIRNEMEIIE